MDGLSFAELAAGPPIEGYIIVIRDARWQISRAIETGKRSISKEEHARTNGDGIENHPTVRDNDIHRLPWTCAVRAEEHALPNGATPCSPLALPDGLPLPFQHVNLVVENLP